MINLSGNEDVLIYFDTKDGNDANEGSKELPVKTYPKAISLIPATWKKKCEVIDVQGFLLQAIREAKGDPEWGQ